MNVRRLSEPRMSGHTDCVCGSPATTTVVVQWADGKRRYRYCADCADGVVYAVEGAEVLP
jgi:hypothetical protein